MLHMITGTFTSGYPFSPSVCNISGISDTCVDFDMIGVAVITLAIFLFNTNFNNNGVAET